MKPGHTGIKRLIHATRFSWRGLKAGCRHEAAIRQEFAVLALTLLALPFMGVSFVEGLMLVGAVLLVLLAELLNSAIEAVVDLASAEYDELAGRAKDMGSAAVLVAILIAAAVFASVFVDYAQMMSLLQQTPLALG